MDTNGDGLRGTLQKLEYRECGEKSSILIEFERVRIFPAYLPMKIKAIR
jgi:hypothetical protein